MKILRSALLLAFISSSSAFICRPLSSKTNFDSLLIRFSASRVDVNREQFQIQQDDEEDQPYTTITAPTNFYKPSNLHTIHIQPFLSKEEANKCLELANEYAKETKCWEQPSDRHVSYKTVDFEVEDSVELSSYLNSLGFFDRITERLADAYDLHPNDLECLDFFCAQYEAKSKTNGDGGDGDEEKLTMDQLKYHRDESLLSFTVLLSEPTDFEGGGTIFDCLAEDPANPSSVTIRHKQNNKNVENSDIKDNEILQRRLEGGIIKPQNQGDCVLHSGKMLHGADKVTSGKRTVFVGFVQVAPYVQAPGTLGGACQEWGRMDVAKLRAEYQCKKQQEAESALKGWKTRNEKWLPQGKGRSHINGFAPFFSSVIARNELAYQRQHRSLTEDLFLRQAILPKEDRPGDRSGLFGGDVTVLEPVEE